MTYEELPSSLFCKEVIDRQFYVLLTYELQRKKMYKIASRVIILITNFGIQYLFSLLTYAFDIICGDIQAGVNVKDIREILGVSILQFQNDIGFSSVVASFFDSLHGFPRRTLSKLSFYTNFPLTLIAIRSKHSLSAIRYMQNELLPEINKHPEVHIPSTFASIFSMMNVPIDSLPSTLFENDIEETDTDLSIDVSLFSVFDEYREIDVLSESFLQSFTSLFPSIPFSKFLVIISHDSYNFLDNFEGNYEIFDQFVPKNECFASTFDIPELAEISEKGCMFIFHVLSYFSDTMELDLMPLLTDWKNKDSQFNLISCIPKINDLQLYFSDATPSDNCWASTSFIRCVATSSDFNKALSIISSTNQADVALYSLFQINDKIPDVFEIFVDSLIEEFCDNCESSPLIEKLWEKDPKTMCNICLKYTSKSFAKVFSLTPKTYQHYLYESSFVKFSTEIAIYASSHKMIHFKDFLNQRLNDLEEIIQNVTYNLDFISDESLNEFFEFVLFHYSKISYHFRNMISSFHQLAYQTRSIRQYDFTYKIKVATEELKFEASRRFETFMNNEITVSTLADIIEKQKNTNPNLFEYMIAILITEIGFMESLTDKENQKIIQILIELIKREIIEENQINTIFFTIISLLENPKTSIKYNFAIKFIEKSIRFLGDHTFFASQLLLNDSFRIHSPKLYSKIDATVKTFNFQEFSDFEPEINLHPNVKRFSNVLVPPQKKIKSLQPYFSDFSTIPQAVEKYVEFSDWIASVIVKKYLESPEILNSLVNSVLLSPRHFDTTIVQCCICRVYYLMNEKDFDNKNGCLLRRSASLLGQLIGMLTLSINNPKNLRFLKIKKLIQYALSNGKLYGVVGFVVSLMAQSSKIFFPPNPFTSSILGYLASISVIPSVKYHIKNQIKSLFEFFNVSIDDVALTDNLFPDRTKNFDFNSILFNLSLLFSENQMDRIINFDQNLYFCFISHCLITEKSIEPNFDNTYEFNRGKINEKIEKNPQKEFNSRDRVRIIWAIYNLIKDSSQRLSRIIVSTVTSTLLKDLTVANDPNAILTAAKQFTKKLALALVSQESFFDYFFGFSHFLNNMVISNEIIELNSFWIHQFLSEVTYALSLSIIKSRIETVELGNTKNCNVINTMRYTISNQFMQLNIPIFNANTLFHNQKLEDHLDVELSKYLQTLDQLSTLEISKDYHNFNDLPNTSTIHNVLRNKVEIESPKVSLQTFFIFLDGNSHILFLEILVFLIENYFPDHKENEKLQEFAAFLLKQYVLPPLALQVLISMNILTPSIIDTTFSFMLNNNLCNERMIEQIVSFLVAVIIENRHFSPIDFIQCFTICAFLPISSLPDIGISNQSSISTISNNYSPATDFIQKSPVSKLSKILPVSKITKMLQQSKVPRNNILCKKIYKIKKLYYEFSTLQQQNTDQKIDPIDNIEYSSMFMKWKNAIRASNETQIITLTKSCSRMPRDFFLSVFEKETTDDILKFLKCLDKVSDMNLMQHNILTAIVAIISSSKKELYKKIYSIIRSLMKFRIISTSDVISSFLHELRPLKYGDFTFLWIELISEPHFIHSNLSSNDNCQYYAPLLCDFSATVGYLNGSYYPNIFQTVYKAFLRLLLILVHDYPDFISSIAMPLISVLPHNFIQIKNIILSVSPRSVIQVSPLTPDLKIDHLSDVHQICFNLLPMSLPAHIEKHLEKMLHIGFDAEDIQFIFDVINENPKLLQIIVEQCFNITVNQDAVTMRTPFINSHIFLLFCAIVCNATSDVIFNFLEAFVDQLRYPSRNTHLFSKLLIELFKLNLKSDNTSVSEAITVALLQRCSIPPPHPWGLVVTVVELMSNKDIGFWDYQFVSTNEKVSTFVKSIYYLFCDPVSNV